MAPTRSATARSTAAARPGTLPRPTGPRPTAASTRPGKAASRCSRARAGTVTLGEPIAFEGMQFRTNGYVIEGGGFALAAAPDTIIRVDPAVTATINAPIADGPGGATLLTKTGAGTLVLGGANSYTGGTLVEGGALQIGCRCQSRRGRRRAQPERRHPRHDRQLRLRAQRHAGRERRHFRDRHRHPADAGRTDHRPGTLGKTGAGTLILSGANTYVGRHPRSPPACSPCPPTPISAPPVRRSIFDGGTLALRCQLRPRAQAARVSLGAAGGTIDTNGNNATLAQAIAGTGALTKSGAGTLTLTGATSIRRHHDRRRDAPGRRWRNHRQPLGQLVDNASPRVQPLGRGDLRRRDQRHRRAHQARRRNAHPDRRQQLYRRHHDQRRHAADRRRRDQRQPRRRCLDNGALVFDRSDAVTFAGTISGTGTLAQIGTGTLTLSGINSHTGGTTHQRRHDRGRHRCQSRRGRRLADARWRQPC